MEKLKKPLARHRRNWEDNIKMDLKDISVDGFDIFHMTPKGSCERGYKVPKSM